MYKWNFIKQNEELPTNEKRLFVNWVNLEHKQALFGIDIVETEHFDWQEYRVNYGRTVYAWSSIMEQGIVLPDEVVDDESLFQYLSKLKFVSLRYN